MALLGHHHCLHHCRHNHCRFCHALTGHRLSGRITPAADIVADIAVRLVSQPRNGTVRSHHLTQGRVVLLDHDHLFADFGHRAGGLDGGYTGLRLSGRGGAVRRAAGDSADAALC
ncbi:hypothetical protein LCGC14_2044760, partial [marine sediment metagenome]